MLVQATWSPGFRDFTSGPIAVTTPAPSCPGTKGRATLYRPSRWYTSMKFTPEAAIFTTASLGLGCGTGKSASCRTSGPPVCFIRMAFMFGFDSDCAVGDSRAFHRQCHFEERKRRGIWVVGRPRRNRIPTCGRSPSEETGTGSKTVPTKDHSITEWLQWPGSLK